MWYKYDANCYIVRIDGIVPVPPQYIIIRTPIDADGRIGSKQQMRFPGVVSDHTAGIRNRAVRSCELDRTTVVFGRGVDGQRVPSALSHEQVSTPSR